MHKVKKCKECKTVIEQCRCMSPNKTVEWSVCDLCKAKATPGNHYEGVDEFGGSDF